MDRERTAAEKEAIAGAPAVDLTPRGVLGLYARWRENPASLTVAEVGALIATVLARNWDGNLLDRPQRDMLWTNAKEVQWAVAAGLKIAPGTPQAVFLIDKRDPRGLRVAGYFDEPAETRNDMCCTVATLAIAASVLRYVGLATVAERLEEGHWPGRVSVVVLPAGMRRRVERGGVLSSTEAFVLLAAALAGAENRAKQSGCAPTRRKRSSGP